jgi:hypothetical protein
MTDGHLSFASADSSVEQISLHLNLCNSVLTSVETFHTFVNSCLDHTVIPILNDFSSVNFVFTQKLDHSTLFCFCAVILSTVYYYDYSGETETEIGANERRFILFRPTFTGFTGLNSMYLSTVVHSGLHFLLSTHNDIFNLAAQKQNSDI